ncbi:flagellar hook-associated protein FlgK [Halovulum sp. GXIMD14793]
MSISSTLSNALSGLTAASRSAEMISNNVANAMTPGYSRRTLELTATSVDGRGTGVAVSGVRLGQDPVAIAARRRNDAELGQATTRAATVSQITAALGTPDQAGALANRAADFEAALIAAANDPASSSALSNLASRAAQYGSTIAQISTETRRMRMDADAQIARQVGEVNTSLKAIELINREIKLRTTAGGETAALIDERQQLIDRVSSILPIKTAQRQGGEIALFTSNGAVLLDGPAAELGFEATGLITQDMTLGSGALSGLTLNGREITIGDGTGSGLMDGGSLSALFEKRDVSVPAFADQLDALAEDLVLRFQDPGVDPTLALGDPGLFTDAGGAYDPMDRQGLAGRLALNAAVDPSAGGAVWRLRDGLNAAIPGNSGSGAILSNLLEAAQSARTPATGLGMMAASDVAGFATELTSQFATRQYQEEDTTAYLNALGNTLTEAETAASGVDTDAEMSKLLLVEQSYAANARVVSVVDTLIQRLLEI